MSGNRNETSLGHGGRMMIDSCEFGGMVVAGRSFGSDLWILPDGSIQDGWWRKDGHRLHREDIASLVATRPEVLVVGTGIYGRMRIDNDIEPYLKSRRIEMQSAWTKEAASLYNQLSEQGRRVAACFHLTC